MPKLKVKMQSCSIREGRGDGSKASTSWASEAARACGSVLPKP